MRRGSSLLAAVIHPDSSPALFLGECSLSSSPRPRQASSSAMPRASPAELKAWQQVANTLEMEDTTLYSHLGKHRNIRLLCSSRRCFTEGRSVIVPVRRGCQRCSASEELLRYSSS